MTDAEVASWIERTAMWRVRGGAPMASGWRDAGLDAGEIRHRRRGTGAALHGPDPRRTRPGSAACCKAISGIPTVSNDEVSNILGGGLNADRKC